MGALRKRWDVAATVLVFLLAVVAERLELFAAVEEQTVSFRQLLRTQEPFPDHVITFVVQDEHFFDAYGSWPLRRTDLGQIAANISALGGRVVALDNLFDFPSSYGEDEPTAALLQQAGNVLTVSQGVVERGRMTGINYPVEPLRGATRSGYTNIQSTSQIVESMSRLRFYPEATALEDGWPFAVQAVAMYLGEEPEWRDGSIHFGDALRVRLPPDRQLRIDFPPLPAAASGYVDVFGLSALELLDLTGKSEDALRELRFWMQDRIVVFGDTSEVSHDFFATPLGRLYGVEIIAATIATLLAGGPLQPASAAASMLVTLLVLAALLATAFSPSPGIRAVGAAAVLTIWALFAVWTYVGLGMIFGMAYVATALVVGYLLINLRFYLQERNQKALIRDAFGQYLSPKVVNILVKDPSRLRLGGERREMTAFFSDVAGFSTISEQLTPEELVSLLNEYLTAMCDIISEYEGTVDKFEGDAIIAFWGAPLQQADHARRACLAAIDMQQHMRAYRERLKAQGRPVLHVRVGLNTGEMLVGNMGSAQRMDYTMMGDAVNLAARLEGANKFYGTYTMISESTYNQARDDVEVRELDLIRVVGRREPVRVYELLGRRGQLDSGVAELAERYRSALEAYRMQRFDVALAGFQSVLELDPDDGPALTYVDRCQVFLEAPPGTDWDGVYQLTGKG